jgi:predicted anti-sigma-YlaC factor YlaD
MGCQELLQLLNTDQQIGGENGSARPGVAAHIRACPSCRRGILQLSSELIAGDVLSCEQCRARFPAYYEATHPEYRFIEMDEEEVREVVIHLGRCAECREEYEVLVELWKMEESGTLEHE